MDPHIGSRKDGCECDAAFMCSCVHSFKPLTSRGQNILSVAGNFLWIALTAACICLFSSMLILRWSSTHFAEEATTALAHLEQCLLMSLDNVCSGASNTSQERQSLQESLLKESVALNVIYSQTNFELRVGRVGGTSCTSVYCLIANKKSQLNLSSH